MPRWMYVTFISLVFAIGLFVVVKFGYRADPAVILPPSTFSESRMIGVEIYRKLLPQILAPRVVVYGLPPQPEWHRDILLGFLQAAAESGAAFDVVIAEAQMPTLDASALKAASNGKDVEIKTVPMNEPTLAALIDELRAQRAADKRVLIYTASIFSTHLLPVAPIARLEHEMAEKYFTVTTGGLALRSERENEVEPPCVGSEVDGQGTAPLGCELIRVSRSLYRSKLPMDRWTAIMVSPAELDFLAMVASPNSQR